MTKASQPFVTPYLFQKAVFIALFLLCVHLRMCSAIFFRLLVGHTSSRIIDNKLSEVLLVLFDV